MYSRLRNTAIGLFAALTFAAATSLVGEPLPAAADIGVSTVEQAVEASTSPRADAPMARKRQSVRVNLAMPYYSFGGLLPRGES